MNTVAKRYYVFRFLLFYAYGLGGLIWALYLRRSVGCTLAQVELLSIPWVIAHAILQLPTGIFADLFGRLRSMRYGVIFYLLGTFGSLVAYGAVAFPLIMLSEVCWGVGEAFMSGALQAWLCRALQDEANCDEATAQERFCQVNVRSRLYTAVGGCLGAGSGLLISYAHLRLVWVVRIAMWFLILWFMRRYFVEGTRSSHVLGLRDAWSQMSRQATRAWRVLRWSHVLLWGTGALALGEWTTAMHHFWPLYTQMLHPVWALGVLWVAYEVSVTIGGVLLRQFPIPLPRIASVMVACLVGMSAFALLTPTSSWWLPLFCLFVMQLCGCVFYTLNENQATASCTDEDRASVLSLQSALGVLGCIPVLLTMWLATRLMTSDVDAMIRMWRISGMVLVFGAGLAWLFRPHR